MSGDTTTLADVTPRPPDGDDAAVALVLIASLDTPHRVGQIAFVEGSCVLGRKGDLRWLTHRPGMSTATGSLEDPRLSRVQARLAPEGRGISVHNTGRAVMFLNGFPATRCVVSPGDTLRFGSGTAVLCVRRARRMPGHGCSDHIFGTPDADGIVGEGAEAWRIRQEIRFLGARDAHVVVFGASGVGKELVARGIHRSGASTGRMVARNAATIPEPLADAELFGNMVNYPQAGMPARPGLVGEAHGGTLFLDEFGELPVAVQAKMLRLLDDGEYTRLGEATARHAQLRLIAATNREPSALKTDMLARFAFRLSLPGLDARREDIPLLVFHLLREMVGGDPTLAPRFCADEGRGCPRVAADLMCLLVSHAYTTHVRELVTLLWHAVRTSEADMLTAWSGFPATLPELTSSQEQVTRPEDLDDETLIAAMARHHGRQEAVWRELGLTSRHVLRRLLIKRGLLPAPKSREG